MKTILKRIITDFHQASLPSFRRRELDVPLNLEKIITIIGPRCGCKTYYLYQIMGELGKLGVARHQMFYLNFKMSASSLMVTMT